METCFICNRHNREEAAHPGHYIYEDEHWTVSHAPVEMGLLGTLFIESKRHFSKTTDMSLEETTSFNSICQKAYVAITMNMQNEIEQILTSCDRDTQRHYSVWIVPLSTEQMKRGIRCFETDESCREEDVITLENKLRETMS